MPAGEPSSWKLLYHPSVRDDLDSVGPAAAARIMQVIHERLYLGEPDKAGKSLRGDLAGWRRIRAGAFRVIYRVDLRRREAYILAAGPRRHEEAYDKAAKRV